VPPITFPPAALPTGIDSPVTNKTGHQACPREETGPVKYDHIVFSFI
jgi:hypothetical protein